MSECQITDEGKALIRAMAKNRLAAGMTDAADIVEAIAEAIHDESHTDPQPWKSEIADIVSGYAQDKAKPTKDELSQRMNALKAELRDMARKADIAMRKIAGKPPKKTRDQRRQEQIKRQIDAIQKRIDAKDYSPPAKRAKIEYNDDTHRAETALLQQRKKIDQLMEKFARQNDSPGQKLWDRFLSLRRAVILSGYATLGKLTAAASTRIVSTPLEEAAGSVLRHLPYISGIAAKAPREGAGFTPRAEGGAIGATFSKDMLRRAADNYRGGGRLDLLFGSSHPSRGLLDVIGQTHGALKTPAKVNEEARALILRSAHERKAMAAAGMTPAEIDAKMATETTQAMIEAKVYEDGQRSILMSNNAVTDAYRGLVAIFKRSNTKKGKVVAGALEYALPIVKIPTNFVFETSSYGIGGAKAMWEVIMSGGRDKLTPDQADYIMRNLKKQTVGAAIMALGAYSTGFIKAGGYYQQGDNKKDGLQKPGTLQLNIGGEWHEVPKYLLHSPPMELLQIGATVRRVAEKEGNDLWDGVMEAGKGLFGEIPFFDTPQRIGHAMTNKDTLTTYAGNEVAGSFVPPDIRKLAKSMDNDAPRKPHGFVEGFEQNIPGMRDDIGFGDPKHMSLDQRMDAYEAMTPEQRDSSNMIKHIRDAYRRDQKTITPEQRDRLRAIMQ